MHEAVTAGERMLDTLLASARRSAPDELGDAAVQAAAEVGGRDVALYLVDYGQVRLRFLGGSTEVRHSPELDLQHSSGGACFRFLRPVHDVESDGNGGTQMRSWFPLLAGAERLGVIGLTFSPDVGGTAATVRRCTALAALIGMLLVVKGEYADAYQRVARREEMSLAAEMQWQILPPLTASTERVTVSGILEPCYDVGGDTFDYAISRDRLHLALFDAMGHGLSSSLLATAAVGAYRHARRIGLNLVESADAIDAALEAQFGAERFVAGLLLELDLVSGRLRWLNAGQPAPLLLRDGRVSAQLTSTPRPPLGVAAGLGGPMGEVGSQTLEPGDHFLVFTDGLVEARAPDGTLFGLERLIELVAATLRQSSGPASEGMRAINQAILAHQDGTAHDDATQVHVQWGSVPGLPVVAE